MQHVALLRGINVGGNNIIPMKDLKACFEGAGYADVRTYIASGNVLFDGARAKGAQLEARIEAVLRKRFRYEARVLVRSQRQLEQVVQKAPPSWSKRNDLRCNIVFLKAPLTPRAALKECQPKPDIDEVATGPGVLYMTALKSALTKSGFPRIATRPVYQNMTIRTYGTAQKILQKMDEAP